MTFSLPSPVAVPSSSLDLSDSDIDLAQVVAMIESGLPLAVVYKRVSTREQGEKGGEADGFSLPAQSDAGLRQAQSLGATVVAEFQDKSTGKNLNRPGLRRLLAFVAQYPVTYVIVHKIDRLARDRAVELQICMALQKAGATLVSCTENIDETPTGALLHGIMSSVAEFYSKNLALEVVKGSVKKAERGGTPNKAPIGYRNIRIVENGSEMRTVKVDPERGPLMAWAFEQYATGRWVLRTLLDELTAKGLTSLHGPKRPSKPLTIAQLDRQLRNPYYKGIVRYRGIDYPGTHPPLVSIDTWNQVQAVLDAHTAGEKQRQHHHYLKGSVFCGSCGSRLIVHHAKNRHGTVYPYFVCIGRHQKRTSCTQPAMQIDYVEALIEDYYAGIRLGADRASALRVYIENGLSARRADAELERRQQENRLADLDDERRKLLQLYYADKIGPDLVGEEQERIRREMETAKRRLDSVAQAFADINETLEQVLTLGQDCHQAYLASGPKLRRQINQAFFEKLYIGDEGTIRSELAEPFALLLGEQLAAEAETALADAADQAPTPAEASETTRPAAQPQDDGYSQDNPPRSTCKGSKETLLVELRRIELLTSSMP